MTEQAFRTRDKFIGQFYLILESISSYVICALFPYLFELPVCAIVIK